MFSLFSSSAPSSGFVIISWSFSLGMRGLRELGLIVAEETWDKAAVEATETGLVEFITAEGGGIAADADVGLLFGVPSVCDVDKCGIVEAGLVAIVGLAVETATMRRRAGSARSPDGILWGSAGNDGIFVSSSSGKASCTFEVLVFAVSNGISFGVAAD